MKTDTGIEVSSQAMASVTCADLFSIAVVCFELSSREDLSFSAAQRDIIIVARGLVDFLLSSEPTLPTAARFESLASLIRDVHQLYSMSQTGRDVLASILSIVLVFRLREGTSEERKAIDYSLHDCFKSGMISLHPQYSTSLVLELILRHESEGDSTSLLVSCLIPFIPITLIGAVQDSAAMAIQASLKGLDQRAMESLKQLLSEKESAERFGGILMAINTALRSQESSNDEAIIGKRKREDTQFRERLIGIVQDDVFGVDRSWIPGDELSEANWISAVLEGLKSKLTRYVG